MSKSNVYIPIKSFMKRFLLFVFLLLGGMMFAQEVSEPVIIADGRLNVCSGTLYDTGGRTGNYEKNELITMTLCPDTPGGTIRLEFTSFLLGRGASLTLSDAGQPIGDSPYTRDNPIPDGRTFTVSNQQGCMTLTWSTGDDPTGPGFSANISCENAPCPTISPRLLRTIPAFASDIEPACREDLGVIRVCLGEEVKVFGDADFSSNGDGATFQWDFDNGVIQEGRNGTIRFNEPGAYRVRFTAKANTARSCSNFFSLIIQVAEAEAEFDLTADKAFYCVGEPINLNAIVKLKEVKYDPPAPESNPVSLPDGKDPVTGEARIFTSTLEFKQFCASATLDSLPDIVSVCFRIHHTYLGDLDIVLIGPGGRSVNLLTYGDTPTTNQHYNLGNPPSFYTYCITPNADQTMREGAATSGGPSLPAGDYLPATTPARNSFNNIVTNEDGTELGETLNGNWLLQIEDKWAGDSGFLDGFSITFADRFDLPDLSFQPEVVSERWLPASGLVETGRRGAATVVQHVPGEYTYAYEVVDNFGCTYTDYITVVVKDTPVLGQIENLQSCIEPETGRASFHLPDVNPSIGGNYDVKYYLSEEEAIADRDALNDIYVFNETSGILERTIWVRVTHPETECYVIDSFKVIAKRCPINLTTLPNLYACRNLDGTVPNFDLTVQTPLVYFNNRNYTVSYYTSMENADNKTNPIATPANYPFTGTGNSMTVYVRVESNSDENHYATTSFMLFANDRPVINDLAPMHACSIDNKDNGIFNLDSYTARIAGGLVAEVRYYTTLQGAMNDDRTTLIPNTNAYQSRTGTIAYRVTDLSTGCFNYGTIDLEVVQLPVLNENVVLTSCSLATAANGVGSFDLNEAIPLVLNNAVDARLEVTFYRTLDNATNVVNAIDLSREFVNDIPNNQTIYARVAYTNGTCSAIVEVDLVVHPKVVVNEFVEVNVCVENLNREVILDLTTNELEILNGLNASEYQITYYTSRNDANLKVRPISNPQHYSSTVTRSVWVRVESIATGCYTLSNLVIVPIQAPAIETLPIFSVCEEAADSGFANFNLSEYLNEFLAGRTGLMVGFYETIDHAVNQVNPLNAINYRNTVAYEQIIYVRFESENGCTALRPLTLKVLAAPVLNIPEEAVGICSVSTDGIGTFDLLALVNDLQNGNPSIAITFFETEDNAINNVFPIPNPRAYTNLTPGGATIYVRGELRGGCFAVKPLELEVITSPVLPIELDDLVMCSADVLQNFASFDLTVQRQVIVNAQTDPNNTGQNLEVKYYLSEANANANTNAISNPADFVNTRDNQVIWYRVYNKRSSCFAVGSFKLIVNKPLALTIPAPIILCQPELPNTGRTVFDLTVREIQILGREIDRVEVKYYENEYDAKQDRNAIADPTHYENLGNPQTIWVGVTSFNGCRSFVSMVIQVNPIPNVTYTPRAIHKCLADRLTGSAEFDLTSREYEIANQSSGYFFMYYNTELGATIKDEEDEILFPARFESTGTTVYVRVTLGSYDAQCFVIVPLDVVVDPLPVFDDIVFLHCIENSTGFSTFNLLEKRDEILNGGRPEDFEIYFYVKEADALVHNISEAIPADYTYTNTKGGLQVIYVRVENKLTGCSYVGPMTLKVEEKVKAFDIDTTDTSRIEACATPPGPNGTANFDLNQFSAEIVGTQNIPVGELGIMYVYNNTPIPVAEVGSFNLPIGTHEITAVIKRVDTADETYLCTAEVTFTLTVEESPIAPVLQGAVVCIDYNTGKLVDPFTIDSGYKGDDYEFQWESAGALGAFVAIPGATKPYYVVEDTALGNTFRVVVKYKGQKCSTASGAVALTFVEEIPIKVVGADSKGLISELDGDERVTVTISSPQESGTFEYALDGGAYQDSRVFYDVANGAHRVWVRYKNEKSICPQYLDIFVLGYPKFFTPNGDGFNDTWNIAALKGHPEAVIYIYDRFGKLLKQLSPSQEGWDGTFNGKPMPSTDYWFTVEYLEEARQANQVPRKVQFKGHFSLKR